MSETGPIDPSLAAASRRRQRAAVLLWFWAVIVTFVVGIGLGVSFSLSSEVQKWNLARANPTAELGPAPLGVWLPTIITVAIGLSYVLSGWIMSSASHIGPNRYKSRLAAPVFRAALLASTALGLVGSGLTFLTHIKLVDIQFISLGTYALTYVFITIGLADHLGHLADFYDSPALRERLVRYLWLSLLVGFISMSLGAAIAMVSAGQPQPQPQPGAEGQMPVFSLQIIALSLVALVFGLAMLVIQILLLMNLHRLAGALGEYVEPETDPR